MRLCDLRSLLGLFFVLPLAAQDLSVAPASGVIFRGASPGHGLLLRDGSRSPSIGRFPLPPGGSELELQPTTSTPYDRYFGSVRAVLTALESNPAGMARACHLMKVGYRFQYVTRDPYRPDPPKLTETQRRGDCKSKALWLFDNLADPGALFVIGKVEKNSRTSHAWVYWRNGGRWWILDCTDRPDPIAADSVSRDRYVPYYSFGKHGAYRHPSTRMESIPVADKAAAVGASDRRATR